MSQVNGDTTTPNPTLLLLLLLLFFFFFVFFVFFLWGGGVELSALSKTTTKIGVACVSDWS